MRNVRHKGDKTVPLDSKCVRMFGSVNFNEDYDIKRDHNNFDKLLCSRFEDAMTDNYNIIEYYFILHTETDKLHIHYAIVLKTYDMELSTMLNYLADKLNVNPLAINITRMDSLCGTLKYFLHKDKESISLGKKQYEPSDLISNMSDFIVNNYLNSIKDDDLEIEPLIYLCLGCESESEVYLHIKSLKFCNKHRGLIHQVFEDRLQLKRYLKDKILPF